MNTNVAQKKQKEQDLTPQEKFTGKKLTRFGGACLIRRFFAKCNWFKEEALRRRANKEMAGTIRWKLFWIPAKLVSTGRRLILKLAEDWIFRDELERAVK